jgi:type IV secretory pathway TraG/TraD family ATPase VirD4
VLGPPRSGKTSSIIIPNVIASNASVVSVSTKRDVLDATMHVRRRVGQCFIFDPSGTITSGADREAIAWSPLHSAHDWDRAVLTAEAMVGTQAGAALASESRHWYERAGALLASVLHGAALDGAAMSEVVSAINRREVTRFEEALARERSSLAFDLLKGILETDAREQSGIWSTCSGVLAGYRTRAALESTTGPAFDPATFVRSKATLYITAPSENQQQSAPLVAGLIRDIRSAAYATYARTDGPRANVLLVLDELANIAPLHDLPQLIAEGASQGVLTIASLQDLSQARRRWGVAAEGFLSLFGTKVVLPGIGDTKTLESLSVLSGERRVRQRSRTLGRQGLLRASESRTVSERITRRLLPSDIARPGDGTALVLVGTEFSRVPLTPAHRHSPWRELTTPTIGSREVTR